MQFLRLFRFFLAQSQVLMTVLNKGCSKNSVESIRDFSTHGLGDEFCSARRRAETKAPLCLLPQLA